MLSAWLAVRPPESAACTVKLFVPVVVGVPEITPVPAFNVSPAVSVPLMMLQLSGVFPPVAESVSLYATLIVPFANDVVVTASGS